MRLEMYSQVNGDRGVDAVRNLEGAACAIDGYLLGQEALSSKGFDFFVPCRCCSFFQKISSRHLEC